MKKLLIATLCMTPLFAQAEAKIGGRFYTAVEYERDGKGNSNTAITDGNSRIWIMGSEELDNGLKLMYGINSFVAHDYSGWSTDDSYIGLKGKAGRVRVGWISTPMHYMTGKQDAFPDNNDTLTMGRLTHYGGRDMSIAYDHTTDNGLTVRAQLTPGLNKYTDEKRNSDWVGGLGLYYNHSSGFNADYAVEYAKDGSPDKNKDRHVHSFRVGYAKDNIDVAAGCQCCQPVPLG